MQAEDFKYLWDGSSPGWVLRRVNADKPGEPPQYCIYNCETKRALLMSDDALYSQVKAAMLANGVRVV